MTDRLRAGSEAPASDLVAIAERLQGICLGRGIQVAAAESCTGGRVAAAITAVPGSSGYFRGGIVSYANDVKVALLGVPERALAEHGAVSAQVARAMAEGALRGLEADLAVAVTGIAGPDGGSDAKPVGLTYLGLASVAGTEVRRTIWTGDRRAIQEAATRAALEWLVEAASR